MGTFNGQEITGFSTYGNPVNGVGQAFANDPDFPNGNPYVGANGILAERGFADDPSLKNGLSFSLADGTSVHIYVIGFSESERSYQIGYQTSAGNAGRLVVNYSQGLVVIGCFVSGTLIRTVNGDTLVESLREEDMVLTYSGTERPIKWVGRSIIRPAQAHRPNEAMPIRILADALSPGVPVRDLLVSPGHAVVVGDVFINAGELVNDATVLQQSAETVNYYHVELDSHDILLANGAPCESYLDDGNRASFVGSGDLIRLHGAIDRFDVGRTCLPLIKDGPLLVAARQRLLARAIELGWRVEELRGLRIELEGGALDPIVVADNRYWFVLPEQPSPTLRFRSSSAILNRVDPTSADGRRLGVAISELRIDGERCDLTSNCFGSGFYAPEDDGCTAWRWTDGNAALTLDRPAKLIEVKLQIIQPVLKREGGACLRAVA